MSKVIVSTWITLDGIFDGDTMEEWFNPYHSDERAEYIKEVVLASDAFLLGRTTYEMLGPYWSSRTNNEMGIADKLNSAPKYVVCSEQPDFEWNNSSFIDDDVLEEITELKEQSGRQITIMGSAALVDSLMDTELIDEYRFLVHPVIMGSGKRFFKSGMNITNLELAETRTMDKGVVLLRYCASSDLESSNED